MNLVRMLVRCKVWRIECERFDGIDEIGLGYVREDGGSLGCVG